MAFDSNGDLIPPGDSADNPLWGVLGKLTETAASVYGAKLNADVQKSNAALQSAQANRAQEISQQNFLARLTGTDNAGKWIAFAAVGALGLFFVLRSKR